MYTLGIDFGTLSARAALFDIRNGSEIASSVYEYPHGVMDEELFGRKLPSGFALQHPGDYAAALKHCVSRVISDSGLDAKEIVGVGIDFTACTLIPLKDGVPLCFYEEFKDEPHAYAKLWKHHAAAPYAERFTELAKKRGEGFLEHYSGITSSEWMFPKVMEILDKAPKVYEAADSLMEAGDYMVFLLTGEMKRSICQAGFKASWNIETGYPSKDFFRELDPRLENVVEEKLKGEISLLDKPAGRVTEKGAALTGLAVGTSVAVSCIDAHSALLASGICDAGKMMLIIGTSGCHIMMNEEERYIPGISGTVKDGFVPGYYICEAGQSCVGDHFDWFVKNCVPMSYAEEARAKGINLHKLLREKAQKLRPGESGLIALDWFNGNRSILNDSELSGMILGYSLRTKPEEIYRALIEATAFGTKVILDAFESGGQMISELYAAGGIASKDPMLMQIYSDVTGKKIYVSDYPQACALGSAIIGSVVAGVFESFSEACRSMAQPCSRVYSPIPENAEPYSRLYEEYKALHDYFGRGGNDVMKRLRELR
ncbi:MAG: ribulokinase [Clostridia bacterium]|nr:ribulokinase [Clostridia bacterium]